jgi:spermidine/putrescine-binding protein
MKRLLVLLFAIAALPVFAKDTLHLYNWNNYIAPETVKRFEESASASRADLLLRQRGAAGQARRRRQGL